MPFRDQKLKTRDNLMNCSEHNDINLNMKSKKAQTERNSIIDNYVYVEGVKKKGGGELFREYSKEFE